MFTGIVESMGIIHRISKNGNNIDFTISSNITVELQVDQSVSHNGVCLTVVAIRGDKYDVSAIQETLDKSNLGELKVGDKVNLERSVTMARRLDGHLVQGHVDTTAQCVSVKELDGSWIFRFKVNVAFDELMVEKGSICINGTSLTVFDIQNGQFSVAIIPYTYKHTIFNTLQVGSVVNVEFDIMGKYVLKYLKKIRLGS